MEKILEKFNPIYREVEQVKRCAILGEPVVDAKIALVIGHNGQNFVSSTDWRLTTASGAKRIFPFFIHPQYPTFIECLANVRYFTIQGDFFVQPNLSTVSKNTEVVLNNEKYQFYAGEPLKIEVKSNSKFIATDCLVSFEETEKAYIYTILVDENTAYGYLDDKGCVSQV